MAAQPALLNLDWDHFLENHWQRKPCLITNAIANWQPPISADELAGLALEEEVESRIVAQHDTQWQLTHGPFVADDYVRGNPWTLLVQAVDHFVPAVAALREYFLALPTWRFDDVMVSYAVDGGSVGPHFDNYDVFLLQGEGCRRWQVGQHCDDSSPLIAHPELRILEHFDCRQEYLLQPGDMLYLPPGVAHWGVAEGDCTTFSIGFRAPRVVDMLSRRIDAQLERMIFDRFLEDRSRSVCARPGEITRADRDEVSALVRSILEGFEEDSWFGELVTEPGKADFTPEPVTPQALLDAEQVALEPATRIAWQEEPGSRVVVFANGHSNCYSNSVLATLVPLCGGQSLSNETLQCALRCPQTMQMLGHLIEFGALYVE